MPASPMIKTLAILKDDLLGLLLGLEGGALDTSEEEAMDRTSVHAQKASQINGRYTYETGCLSG